MHYHRTDVTDGRYFFTVNLTERNRTLLVGYVATLRKVMHEVKAKRRFRVEASKYSTP
jgi:hypothetical protein